MKKFNFRLQKVLEYRKLLEQWAKDSYLEARTARLEGELGLLQIAQMREEALAWPANSLDARRLLENQLKRLDQKEVEQRLVVNVLANEEEQARQAWNEKKIELEALNKMYDRQHGEWQMDMDRKVQTELDEWALRRRAA